MELSPGGTTSASEITDIAYNSATFTGNNSTGALLVQSGLTATITGATLSVGDNTAGHQAGVILNNGTIAGTGTLNFGADEGIIYGFGGGTLNTIITGTGGRDVLRKYKYFAGERL